MADTSVFINGAAEGAFTDALNGLPAWATEDTLLLVESHLRKSFDVQKKGFDELLKQIGNVATSTGSNPATQKAANDALDTYLKELKKTNEELEKDRNKKKKDDTDKESKTKKQKIMSEAMTKVLTGLIAAGTKILKVQDQYFNTSNDLFKSGINLLAGQNETQSSMLSLNQMITLTGLRLETLQKVVEKYTSSINAVGLLKFTKTLSLTNQKMQQLGYSTEEQAELLGTLVESESSYSDIRSKTTQQLADDAFRLGGQLNKLSLTTGISNAQLQDNIKALAKNSDSMVVSAIYGEKAAENMNLLAASAKDTDIGNMFQKIAAAVTPEITAPFKALNASGLGEQAVQLTRIIQASRDGSISATQAMEQTTAVAKSMNSAQIQALKIQEQAGTEGASEAITVIAKLRAQGNTLSKATDGQAKQAVDNQAKLSAFSSEVERARAQMQKTFPLLEEQVEHATTALKLFNDTLDRITGSMSATTRSWIGVGIEAAALVVSLAASVFGLKTITGSMTKIPGMIGDAASGLRSSINSLGPILGKLGAGLGVTAAAAFAAYEVWNLAKASKALYDIKNREGVKSSAGQSVEDRKKNFTPDEWKRWNQIEAESKAPRSQISVPKNPTQSTINSPSAVSANETKPDTDVSAGAPTVASAAVGSGIEKPPSTSDINSLMTYQNSISEQVLLGINNLVSVNKEILKYSRVN